MTAATIRPRFMREVPAPALTPALEDAIARHMDEGPFALFDIRTAAAAALRRIGLPHSGSEDFSFIRTGELLPHLAPTAVAANPQTARPGTDLPAAPATGAAGTSATATPATGPQSAPVTALSAAEIAPWILPEARDSYAVLVDGVYVPELSRPGEEFHVQTLEAAAPPDSPLPGMHLRFQGLHDAFVTGISALLAAETDPVASIASLFARHPLLVRVPAKRVAASPLLLLHFTTGSGRSDALTVVHAGPQSESRVLIRHVSLARPVSLAATTAPPTLENAHTVALIEDGASLRMVESGAEGSPAETLNFRKLTARLDRNARLQVVAAHTGSRLMRQAFAVDLAGEGAEAEFNGAAVLSGNRQSHNHVLVRHLVPHCVSRQLFKTVATDQSRSSVDGTIIVALDAQQTNANQLINNLMLSDEARADSKPRLMIHADDVKCSHGATSGKLDPAQQFYLESRGLPPAQARGLLTVAFIAEVVAKAGKAGGTPDGEAFRDTLDHALLDSLRNRMPMSAPSGAKVMKTNETQGGKHA